MQKPGQLECSDLLIFVHIVKTGGTSLRWALEDQFSPSRTMMCYSALGQTLDNIRKMTDDQKLRYQLLSTHYGFGVHKYFPQRSKYVTMLREPFDRSLSEYWDFHYPDLKDKNRVDEHFSEFVQNMPGYKADNAQVRFVAGALDVDCVDETHLSEAIQNLDKHFAAVGISELYNQSLALFCRIFGWFSMTSVRCNVTRPHPDRSPLGESAKAAVREYNKLDTELYAYAKARYERDVRDMGITADDVSRLVKTSGWARNRIYGSRVLRKLLRNVEC